LSTRAHTHTHTHTHTQVCSVFVHFELMYVRVDYYLMCFHSEVWVLWSEVSSVNINLQMFMIVLGMCSKWP